MITVGARLPAPYVHADNRGLVLCNGPDGEVVLYAGTQEHLLSVTVGESDFRALREAIVAR